MGCAHCRANAAWWNEQMRVIARERLFEPAADLSDPSTSIRCLAACGPMSGVLAQATEQYDIDVIVLPWRRAVRLRRLLRVSDAERLARPRRWEVVIAPVPTGAPVGHADRFRLSARRAQDSSPRGRRVR